MPKFVQNLISIIITILLAIILFFLLIHSAKTSEKNECLKWEKQSQEYIGWYSNKWMRDQCQTYNIILK
ncbi:MAG: hypothetical protein WA057_05225 [Candidatus Magasanikiibacteriota bacterium]